jgi:hypothetical protein
MCKRLILSRDFYPTLMKEHVDLVTEGIDHVEARGVVTTDGKLHELDVLVLATGFDTHAWGVDHVVGADGLSLKDAWSQGTRAYRSVAMPGFPNFFMLVGPNSPIGNISLIDVSEVQAEYIMRCIHLLRKGKGIPRDPARGHEGHRLGHRLQQLVPGCGRRPEHVALDRQSVPQGDAQAPPRRLRAARGVVIELGKDPRRRRESNPHPERFRVKKIR